MDHIDDKILKFLEDIAEQDCSKSFKEVYNHYYNRLFQQALYYLNNNFDYAQEVVSDVFVALWQSRKILNKINNPDSYFFIALKHAASRYVEKHYSRDKELLTDNLPETYNLNNSSDLNIRDKELQEKYEIAVNNLPPRCAEVFRQVREERKKYSEVAEILGISVKTVDNQMNKAVKLLYKELKENLLSGLF